MSVNLRITGGLKENFHCEKTFSFFRLKLYEVISLVLIHLVAAVVIPVRT